MQFQDKQICEPASSLPSWAFLLIKILFPEEKKSD